MYWLKPQFDTQLAVCAMTRAQDTSPITSGPSNLVMYSSEPISPTTRVPVVTPTFQSAPRVARLPTDTDPRASARPSTTVPWWPGPAGPGRFGHVSSCDVWRGSWRQEFQRDA